VLDRGPGGGPCSGRERRQLVGAAPRPPGAAGARGASAGGRRTTPGTFLKIDASANQKFKDSTFKDSFSWEFESLKSSP